MGKEQIEIKRLINGQGADEKTKLSVKLCVRLVKSLLGGLSGPAGAVVRDSKKTFTN